MAPKFCYCFQFETCVELAGFGETDYSIVCQPNDVEDFVGVVELDATLNLATKHTMGFIPIFPISQLNDVTDANLKLLCQLSTESGGWLLGNVQNTARQSPFAKVLWQAIVVLHKQIVAVAR